MIDFLNSFKSLIKLEQIRTDNNVFKLHYKFTVILLIVFSLLLTSKQYFGDPITCNVGFNNEYINTYCWIRGTFILTSHSDGNLEGLGNENLAGSEISWQKYYQWVCIVFCLQALLFYLPRYLWKTWEGGRLRLLIKDLNSPLVASSWNHTEKQNLVHHLMNVHYCHDLYAYRYTICEVLNLINVVCQIVLMDLFLSGNFSTYGIAVAALQDANAMEHVFPKLAKCTIKQYGPSAGIQNFDAICVLPLNMLNEKLFLILWFWLILLAALTAISLIYRVLIVSFPTVRAYLLMAQARFIGMKRAKFIVSKISYGDFFLLYHIGKNINPIIFKELVLEIHSFLKVSINCKVTSSELQTI